MKRKLHQYRVTKYDPAFRDAHGAYTKDEWTAFSDIGRLFRGLILSREEYLRVESAYIAAAMNFLAEDGASALRALSVEHHRAFAQAPAEGSLISLGDLPTVCRSVLREDFWCKLEHGGRFVHFGYDFYMYVGVQNTCDDSIAAASAIGLFVEPVNSPYLKATDSDD